MINKLINGLFGFVWGFVGSVTGPISQALTAQFPDLSNYGSAVQSFLNTCSSLFAWVVYLIPRPLTLGILGIFVTYVGANILRILAIKILGMILDLVKRVNPFTGK